MACLFEGGVSDITLTFVVVSPCGVLDWSIELGELLVAVYILISNADFKFPNFNSFIRCKI